MDTFYRGRYWKEGWKAREEEEGLDKSTWAGLWRTDMGNSRKRHNIKKSGVVGHLDLSGGRLPEEYYKHIKKYCTAYISADHVLGTDGGTGYVTCQKGPSNTLVVGRNEKFL